MIDLRPGPVKWLARGLLYVLKRRDVLLLAFGLSLSSMTGEGAPELSINSSSCSYESSSVTPVVFSAPIIAPLLCVICSKLLLLTSFSWETFTSLALETS